MNHEPPEIDEGYVKYRSHWEPGPPPDASLVLQLSTWRKPLFAAGLVGHYADLNVGYGNISVRVADSNQFVISGTQTGHIESTGAEHYALVSAADIDANSVHCIGPIQASSEALTHAALYALSNEITAVVHVHDRVLWQQHLDHFPTTDKAVPYGTPEMANEFRRLWHTTRFAKLGIAIMAGHNEGIVSVGSSLEQAATRILALKSPD